LFLFYWVSRESDEGSGEKFSSGSRILALKNFIIFLPLRLVLFSGKGGKTRLEPSFLSMALLFLKTQEISLKG
jgi:hypothetical protein